MDPKIVKYNLEGEVCPYPLIMTMKKFVEVEKDIKSGVKALEITTDCPAATENIPREFEKRGMRVDIKKEQSGMWRIIISKN